MVDRGDQVLLDGPRVLGLRDLALHHVEVVGGVRQVGVGIDRVEPVLEPVERGEQRGHDGARLERLAAQLGAAAVEPRSVVEVDGHHRVRRAKHVERWRVRAAQGRHLGQQVLDLDRDRAPRLHLVDEVVTLSQRRQLALEEQVPHVLERPLLRQLDRVVLPVVVEALEAAHVADGRVGHDHALEALGDLGRRALDRLHLGDAHEVAHRHQPDELRAVDDRDVAVPVLGQGRERLGGGHAGRHRVGVRRHPFRHVRVAGVGTHDVTGIQFRPGALAQRWQFRGKDARAGEP